MSEKCALFAELIVLGYKKILLICAEMFIKYLKSHWILKKATTQISVYGVHRMFVFLDLSNCFI